MAYSRLDSALTPECNFPCTSIISYGPVNGFELAVYGLTAGLLYKALPKKIPYIYVSLILSMLIGRIVWGLPCS